ncbi:hypothetical protein CLOHYLEM_06775 [[Clostridium] hylemonae DSM 15053]|uniref:Uncharacterized protein n=1 Tax=[Clostridium] hylemonae DSM 15053 TaxID=553973 RepID=C0C3W3_9FIRM|nr:hypothetical protein CLOHYLEM_06775 [[Clostridium] hylemonae DSM 15053]
MPSPLPILFDTFFILRMKSCMSEHPFFIQINSCYNENTGMHI